VTTSIITSRGEWTRRYAARVMERTGMEERQAMDVANVGAECYAEQERETSWEIKWTDPEGAADEEISYWENDGED